MHTETCKGVVSPGALRLCGSDSLRCSFAIHQRKDAGRRSIAVILRNALRTCLVKMNRLGQVMTEAICCLLLLSACNQKLNLSWNSISRPPGSLVPDTVKSR